MAFSDILNKYMSDCSLTVSQLAEKSGVSKATISRFKNGLKQPKKNSETLYKLATAITIANDSLSYEEVLANLTKDIKLPPLEPDAMTKKLNLLITALDINAHDLSRHLKYDASYLSRIRSNQRRPANPVDFCNGVAEFVSKHFYNSDTLPNLLGVSEEEIYDTASCKKAVFHWLTEKAVKQDNALDIFLRGLDGTDINMLMMSAAANKPALPEAPAPESLLSKSYYGLNEFMEAELNWVYSTIYSNSNDSIIFYSDMPMSKMADDTDFSTKFVMGVSAILGKGIHINVIHNVERSFYEMMLGLNGWLPLYMTGLVSPYYLKGMQDPAFNHLLYVSGASALNGEAVKGYHENGKYYFTANKKELAYFRERGENLLKNASPLMEIYNHNNADIYNSFFINHIKSTTTAKRSISSVPPVYTISTDLLVDILDNNNIDKSSQQKIIDFVKMYRNGIESQIADGCIINVDLSVVSKEEFENAPLGLSLADLFISKELNYTYEQYQSHIAQTQEFSVTHNNYNLCTSSDKFYRNIQIRILQGNYAIVTKNSSPAIHFVIKHPKLRNAIEHIDFQLD